MKDIKGVIRNMPQSVKASAGFFAANLVMSGISYIMTPIYTRMLSTTEYGQTAVFLTWLQIFGTIAMFCLSAGVFNNGMVDYPEKRDEYAFSLLMLSNVITLCFSAVLLGIYPFIKGLLKLDIRFLILMCFVFLLQPAYNFWIARQRYELKYKPVLVWSTITAVVSPVIAVICMICFPDNRLSARIFGAEVALIAVYLVFYLYWMIKNKCKINTKYWKTAFLFNLPLIPHYLSTYLLGNSDKLMISYLINDTATAYYTVAYSIAAVALIVWSAMNSTLIPYTYEKCKKKDYNAISNVTMPILTFFALVCVVVIMFAPEVVRIMATKEYMEAIYAIPPIIGGVFFQVQYFIYANIVYYYKKPKYVMIASVAATILNIILNYVFISKFGYLAAGYTTIFCYLVQAAIDYWALKKVVNVSVYNMKYIGILSVIVVVVALLSNFVYDYTVARYAIILLLLFVCILFRKRIIKLVMEMRGKKNEA